MTNTTDSHIPATTPAPQGEVMITRAITFRHSTFGALKGFIRHHTRNHGVLLSNAAAVDYILRSWMEKNLPRGDVQTMLDDARPEALRTLREMPLEDTHGAPLEMPARRQTIQVRATPQDEFCGPKQRIIDVRIPERGNRPVPTAQAAGGAA